MHNTSILAILKSHFPKNYFIIDFFVVEKIEFKPVDTFSAKCLWSTNARHYSNF